MSFNSYGFILLFLPITVLCYFAANHYRRRTLKKAILLLSSLLFYAYYSFSSLAIMAAVSLLNYVLARKLQSAPCKGILIWGILLNIVVLSFFKYFTILSQCISELLHSGFQFRLLFPLGVSFLTFQQIAYLVDTYRGEVCPHNFWDYLLFAFYFPKIAQGPIVYHNDLIPQIQQCEKQLSADYIAKGLYCFAIGLGKKVLLAELLGKIVTYCYGTPGTLSSLEAILAILSYTFQLYFDFSGYCDMAVGISMLFHIDLPQNFNSPYKALSISDFWKRWHITLTRFLTKYVYIPLGGNRKCTLRTYVNILIVFLISGIWHGVGIPFLLWGLLHGLAQVLYRLFRNGYSKFPKVLQWLGTFLFVNLAWVYFRADSIETAHTLLSRLACGGFSVSAELAESLRQATLISVPAQFIAIEYVLLGLIALCLVLVCLPRNSASLKEDFKPKFTTFLTTFLLLLCSLLSLSGVGGFLYTNF